MQKGKQRALGQQRKIIMQRQDHLLHLWGALRADRTVSADAAAGT
jgi:hypothetical protein